jgi:hypothetical protein
LRVHANGTLGTAGSVPTLSVTVLIGGVTATTISIPVTASLSGAAWELDYYVNGTSISTAQYGGCFHFYGSAGAMLGGCSSGQATGLNFASNQNVDVQVTWGTASSSNTLTANELIIFPDQKL